MARKHHHVISKGYQRFFADGERIRLVDKVAGRDRVVSVTDAFARKHFNAVRTDAGRVDELEDEWQRVENASLPSVRALIAGDHSANHRHMAKVLAAVHLARSFAFELVWDRVWAATTKQRVDRVPANESLLAAFLEDFGRDPEPGEIEGLMAGAAAEMRGTNALFVERMAAGHNRLLEWFAPMHVQLVTCVGRSMPFITGDVPVANVEDPTEGFRVGVAQGLAVGDSGHIYMPLGRRLGMFLTTRPEDDVATEPWKVQRLNRLVWRAAIRHVACHPEDDLRRAVALDRSGVSEPPTLAT